MKKVKYLNPETEVITLVTTPTLLGVSPQMNINGDLESGYGPSKPAIPLDGD